MESLHKLESVIDREALLTRCLNKLEFAERMLNLFQANCAGELEELDQALKQKDFEALRRISHRVAGASANAAAIGMRERASQLRRAANQDSHDEAARCLELLHHEFDRFQAAMSSEGQSR